MKKSQSRLAKLLTTWFATVAPLSWAYQIADKDINGYWQMRSADSRLFGVINLHVHDDHLVAHGIRLNVINPKQKINWTCTYGHPSLHNQAVWGGGVLLDMQRSESDQSYFYNGKLISAVGCMILHPKILFTSATTAKMTIDFPVDLMGYDKHFMSTSTFYFEKISKKKALQGCVIRITDKDRGRWGDLVNDPRARRAMLKELNLSKKAWLKLANNYQICFDQ